MQLVRSQAESLLYLIKFTNKFDMYKFLTSISVSGENTNRCISIKVVGLAFHVHLSVVMQYFAKQHKIAVSFSKTKSSRPMSDQNSNPISWMINITCQSPLENKIFVAISQSTRTFEYSVVF